MKSWARFVVVEHHCLVGSTVGLRRIFYASTIVTARAFKSRWGGWIEKRSCDG